MGGGALRVIVSPFSRPIRKPCSACCGGVPGATARRRRTIQAVTSGLAAGLRSSIGRKWIVAVTGVALLGFVIAHMLGNLQVFLGPDALNSYAAKLAGLGPLLWAARLLLLAAAIAHVAVALQLAAENRAARPVRYAARASVQGRTSARSMAITGCMILLFVLYHLAHFTWGLAHPELTARLDSQGRHDVYAAVVGSFQVPSIAALYVAAMVLLGLHLWHGASSLFQTLGWNGPRSRRLVARLGPLVAAFIVLGNCSIPLAVLTGLVGAGAGAG